MEKEILNYEAPLVEVICVDVEKGFAASVGSDGNESVENGGDI